MTFKEEIDIIDATPSKRIYQSIIADYDLVTAICELIDNTLDARKTKSCKDILTVYIEIDTEQQSIVIEDNACGVNKDELRKLISPGETSSDGVEGVIGIFGVGSKRAVVALAQDIKITTRCEDKTTYRLEYDDEWLQSDDWDLLFYEVPDINENTTIIELSKLRFRIEDSDVEVLREEIGAIYAHFIKDGDAHIILNNKHVEGYFFDQWAFPPEFTPTKFIWELVDFKSTKKIDFTITSGLTYEGGSIAGNYGVFIYCNKRLIAPALKTPEVGFPGTPHPSFSLARVIVNLSSSPDLMPWLSNKRGISYNHPTFRTIRADIIEALKHAVTFSRILKENAITKVEPFKEGTILEKKMGITERIKSSKLPPVPKTRRNYKDDVISLNKLLGVQKPWTKGLYESLIAEELIFKQKQLSQKNRISLIILDSAVEIGCKEYLSKETPNSINEDKLSKLNRIDLQKEVEKTILTGDDIWLRFKHYYYDRCYLIHKRASGGISDSDILQLRNDVKTFFEAAFGIRFPV